MPAEGYKFRGCVYPQPRCIYPEACMAGFRNMPKVGAGVKRRLGSPKLQTRPKLPTPNGGCDDRRKGAAAEIEFVELQVSMGTPKYKVALRMGISPKVLNELLRAH